MKLHPTVVAELDARGLTPACDTADSPTYDEVIDLARRAYGDEDRMVSVGDCRSRMYGLRLRDRLVATLTVTLARTGEFDAEDRFPAELIAVCRPVIGTAYRLAVEPELAGDRSLARLVMRTAMSDGIRRGVRLVLVTARPEMVVYYRRCGFRPISAHPFSHSRLETPHFGLWYPVRSEHPGLFRDLMGVADPLCDACLSLVNSYSAVSQAVDGQRHE